MQIALSFHIYYSFLVALGHHGCAWLFLVAASGGFSLVVVLGLLIEAASHVAEFRL